MGDEMVAEGMKKANIIIDDPLHVFTHFYKLWKKIQHITT
jgi:hypothetical protein